MRWFHHTPDLIDAASFTAAMAALIGEYPYDSARHVCGPTGIASRLKFFPSLAELREALEAEVAPLRRQAERYRRAKEQAEIAAPVEVPADARARAVERWEKEREDFATEDREARAAGDAARRERFAATTERMRLRDLVAAGFQDDGRPLGPELRKKLTAMGARFEAVDNHRSRED